MAVVRNLMIRIGADFSAARKGMQGATRELDKFKRDTTKTTRTISGRNGLGGIDSEFKTLGASVSSSLAQIRGAKGIGGVVSGLRELRPALGVASTGLRGFGLAAGGATAALGPLGIGIAAVTAVLAIATAGIAAASQEAVRFEANLGRLNMQLGRNSREFMNWARSMGLAKTTAADMGATYGTLLSSFIRDNDDLLKQTKAFTQATRVVASATGRSFQDVTERMRSGLLGNTEAIEDLGIFVNVSMIESTEAFRKFAGDKSWEQIDFQLQQQIRLAAILEQSYKRYGNELQQNVMTKQTLLVELLKDIKLNLSQAFLPIWDVIIPAITRFAEALANLTEQLARFSYWVRGWDYDEMTQGTDRQTGAINDQGDAYADLARQAAKARNELASFDEINQFGSFSGGGTGGASGGSTGDGSGSGSTGDSDGGFNMPELPTLPKLQLLFEPPSPPDAGMGAVATAVVSTVNTMVETLKLNMQTMWSDLGAITDTGLSTQDSKWRVWSGSLTNELIPTTTESLLTQWSNLFIQLSPLNLLGVTNLGNDWSNMWNRLTGMNETGRETTQGIWDRMYEQIRSLTSSFRTDTVTANQNLWLDLLKNTLLGRFVLETEWSGMFAKINTETLLSNSLVSTTWHETLDFMQVKLNAYRPYLEWGFTLIGQSVVSLIPQLNSVEFSWSSALTNMVNQIREKTSMIITSINSVIKAWAEMESTVSGKKVKARTVAQPDVGTLPVPEVAYDPWARTDTGRFAWADNHPILGPMYRAADEFAEATKPIGETLGQFVVPGAQLGGAVNIGRGAISQGSKYVDDALKTIENMLENLRGFGNAIPQLATGGIVSSPTLAMIGEAGPEAVVPLEDTGFVDAIGSAVGTAVAAALQIVQGGQDTGGDIVVNVDGATLARVTYPYFQREQQRIGTTAINPV